LECLDPEKGLSESGTAINRSGESGTEKDQEHLEPKITSNVWNYKLPDLENLELIRKIPKIWNWNKADQESLEPKESRPGESGTKERRPGESGTKERRPGESGTERE
jgi:hypothetical protein